MRETAYGTYGNAVAGGEQEPGSAQEEGPLRLAALRTRILVGYSNCQRAVGRKDDPVAGPASNLSNLLVYHGIIDSQEKRQAATREQRPEIGNQSPEKVDPKTHPPKPRVGHPPNRAENLRKTNPRPRLTHRTWATRNPIAKSCGWRGKGESAKFGVPWRAHRSSWT